MILVRAPFRISFIGGGSDLRSYYENNKYGAVVSTSINKYMYIVIHPYFHQKIRLKYSKTEDVNSADEIEHPIARECLKRVGVEKGIEISSIADVPAGTGLGSSSAFTICLLQALYAYKNIYVTKEHLAAEACEIEIDILKEPIGKQDQYACAYGGLNYIQFNNDESVFVEKILCFNKTIETLEENLLMFYVGNERKASSILKNQKNNMNDSNKIATLTKMVEMGRNLNELLLSSEVEKFGRTLHEGWLLKKELAEGISNPKIEQYYESALQNGAIGGKLLGAGGGGFLLIYCKKNHQRNVRKALGLREMQFGFDKEGVKVLYFGD